MARRRGRPTGYKLSPVSKIAISESKKGQKHTPETRDKISRTLMLYFRKLNPLSEEIIYKYCRSNDDDTCGWINDMREDLDADEFILTERTIRNINKIEISFGENIEFLSHNCGPEFILEMKEECEALGLNIEDYL
jgi:hypothetical protein